MNTSLVSTVHVPVMLNEVLSFLPEDLSVYVDMTAGGGGHAEAILKRYPNVRAVLMDRDPNAAAFLKRKFSSHMNVTVINGSASLVDKYLFLLKIEGVDFILTDLGFSSDQLEQSGRGFSFDKPEPFDLRMDPSLEKTALDYVKELPFGELVRILSSYGEERESKRVARALKEGVEEGLTTSLEFAEKIKRAKRYRPMRIHPATQTFMALRILVNNELEELTLMLERGFSSLRGRGRFAVITFHSLEDRIVKRFFKEKKEEGGVRLFKLIKPSREEITANPRSRSAKLRVLEKI